MQVNSSQDGVSRTRLLCRQKKLSLGVSRAKGRDRRKDGKPDRNV
jgi:hypothetical protein